MKVVITGATGHLGHYAAAELSARGDEVVAVSRSGATPKAPYAGEAPSNVRALSLDLNHDDAVAKLAAELGPEVVLVHLAAWHPPSTASTGAAERRQLLETNVFGTMRALDAARRTRGGVAAVVYASSFEVYGAPEQPGPVTESARLGPLTDYGASKLSGEDHLFAFAYEERTRVVSLRFPAIYGPGEHTPRALPNFLKAVAAGQRPKIFGDGGDLRDQIHGRDAARAIVSAVSSAASGIYNVSDAEPHSILELARTAMELAGMPGDPEMLPIEKPRIDFHMNIDKARAELGFTPSIPLAAGMREQLAALRAGG